MALNATALIVGLAGALSGLEGYAGRVDLRPGGLLDVSIASRGRRLLPGWAPSTKWMSLVWLAYLVCSLTLLTSVIAGSNVVLAGALVGLAVCVVVQAALLPYGRDGSDEMAVVITVPLAAACVLGAPTDGVELAMWFIAAQLALSYWAAGVAKTRGAYWRDGSAFQRIAKTMSYGHPALAAGLARRPLVGQVATWGALGWELTMPIALVLGGPPAVIALGMGAAFHVANACIMGLNRFVPWFLAAYPAALFVSLRFGLLS